MKNKRIVFKKSKELDKLIEKYKNEKTIKLDVTFNSILERLKAEKKLDDLIK